MKDLSPQLRARIKAGVTTLCTCISVVRRDGVGFYFTDHDEPVNTGGLVHLPFNSFSRTSVQTSADLDVDSMEIRGILNSQGVGREDVASGKFDFAEVSVYWVDYESPELGRVEQRTGWMGEVVMNEDGTFEAEVRGLSQIFTYRIGEAYAPECRANLGDKRCKVALMPKRWQPTTAYRQGDAILGVVNAASNYRSLAFENVSFDANAGQGLKLTPDGWQSFGDEDGRWGFTSTIEEVSGPKSGSVFMFHTHRNGGRSIYRRAQQSVDLVAQGVDLAGIDTGLSRLVAGVWSVCISTVGTCRMQIDAHAADGTVTTLFDSGQRRGAMNQWFRLEADNLLIPAGTRKLVFQIEATKRNKNDYGTGFDAINAAINYPDGTYGSADQFGDVCFVAQSSGVSGAGEPAFSGLIGSDTAEGDIVWKAMRSWSKVGYVRGAASDNRSFVPKVLTDEAGYYDGGLITWETGRNAGRTQEIKSWKGGRLTLFMRPYYLMTPNDRFVVRPGCDKRRVTCAGTFGNVLNFRGEPDVPGQDEFYKTPNSTSSD